MNLSYTYDKVGNITQIVDSYAQETLNFTYDDLNQLDLVSGAHSDDPWYDHHGNLAQKKKLDGSVMILAYPSGYPPQRPHIAISAGGNTYAYDANGNMISRTISGVTYTPVYDSENRLISINGNGLSAIYTYNGDGKRVKAEITTGTETKPPPTLGTTSKSQWEIPNLSPRPRRWIAA